MNLKSTFSATFRPACLLLACTLLPGFAFGQPNGSRATRLAATTGYVEGELMVHYRTSGAPLAAILTPMTLQAKETAEIPYIGWHRLKITGSSTTAQAVKNALSMSGVDKAEPNYVRAATQLTPNDPGYSQQYGPQMIGCPYAWTLTLGSSSVILAFVDSGVDLTNPEFSSHITTPLGSNIISGTANPQDDNGHGTHVCGIAAASINNSYGIAGVCPQATILPVKALDASGSGTIANLASGYIFAADNGANVINVSAGGTDFSQTEKDAVDYAINKGAIFVAAAGNNGDGTTSSPLFYPAAYPGVISVGAVDSTGAFQSWSEAGSWVKVAAPGVGVYSTWLNKTFQMDDGTSMSSPHVAGSLALLKSYAQSGTTNVQLENALYEGCTGIGSWVQYGIINVNKSLGYLTAGQTSVTTSPVGVAVYGGVYSSGGVGSLGSVDGNDYVVQASTVSGVQYAGIRTNYLLTQSLSTISSLKLQLSAAATASATATIYAYNIYKGRYENVGTTTVGTSQTTSVIALPAVRPYVRSGEVRLITVTTASNALPLTLSVDQAALLVTTS